MSLIKKGFSFIKKYYKLISVGIIIILIGFISILFGKIKKNNVEINRLLNNNLAYEQLMSNTETSNRVLQLTVDDLNTSKDSLIQALNTTKKELKIKDKQLKTAAIIKTQVKDSSSVILKSDTIDNVPIKINDLTTVTITKTDSVLTAKIEMYNTQTLFVIESKEYRKQYKNGWKRFWHFDWHKVYRRKYIIENSNPAIKVTNTRVIEITN